MSEYLSPGVYIEEIKIGAQPIEGVSTSTAAFLGIAEKGPLNKPTLVTNQKDFVRTFGGYIKESYLAYAVDGFFRNGGKRCFIVRVAHADAAKAHESFNNMGHTPLMLISALNEGEWGSKINVKVQESSSGSTALFLSALKEDANKDDTQITLYTTAGLSKDSKILIADGSTSSPESLTVDSLGPGNVVNLSTSLINSYYNKLVTYVYVQLPKDSVGATVKSASGFSTGMVVGFDSADPATQSKYVTLSAVKQPERLLEWVTPLPDAIDGAACVDINGVEIELKLANSISAGINHIDLDQAPPLKIGDKVTFSSGPKKETLTVNTISVKSVGFEEKFINSYVAANTSVTAMTSSKTNLFSTTLAIFKKTSDKVAKITIADGITGLQSGDRLTITDNDSLQVKFIIDGILDDRTFNVKLKPAATIDDTKFNPTSHNVVKFTIGDNKIDGKKVTNAIVVKSPEGFSVNNLIDIKIGIKTRRYRIIGIENNRISFEGPDWIGFSLPDATDAEITAKQWIPTTVTSQDFQIIAVYGDNEAVEKFDKLSISGSSERYFAKEGVINKVSSLIEVKDGRLIQGSSPTSKNDLPELISRQLAGGANGSNIAAADYIGTITQQEERTGMVALEPVDEVNLLVVPDLMLSFGGIGNLSPDDVEQVQLAMIAHCEKLKDRFAILDPIRNHTVQQVQAWRKDNLDSKYAAIYYPWIKVSDPIGAENSTSRFIPPSGCVAGIYARSDTERGVHKAPANETVSGVIELERTLTSGEQDMLNPNGINCIRAFQGRGIRVWGARTISSDSLWKYINVRRLFLYIEGSIEKSTQWVVFEPNNERLWGRIRATITEFLTRVWKDGALMGTKAEEAFFVRCDRTTMTQDDIDNGRLIILIGIAPVKPAEFVIFRIAQWAGGSAVTE